MFETKAFMYQKPDSVPKEKNVLVFNESEMSIEGIELTLLGQEDKIALSNAISLIKQLIGSGKYRKYLKTRIVV